MSQTKCSRSVGEFLRPPLLRGGQITADALAGTANGTMGKYLTAARELEAEALAVEVEPTTLPRAGTEAELTTVTIVTAVAPAMIPHEDMGSAVRPSSLDLLATRILGEGHEEERGEVGAWYAERNNT